MKHSNDNHVVIEFDDEHPFFTAVWENARAARREPPPPAPDAPAIPPPPETLTAEVRIGDAIQRFVLDTIVGVQWRDARAVMTTRWRPAADPTSTTQPTGDTTK